LFGRWYYDEITNGTIGAKYVEFSPEIGYIHNVNIAYRMRTDTETVWNLKRFYATNLTYTVSKDLQIYIIIISVIINVCTRNVCFFPVLSLWSSGQSSWLHNGDVLCFL
jgi:uncharacterized membrane protein YkgB